MTDKNNEPERTVSPSGAVPIAPSLKPTLDMARIPEGPALVDSRVVRISAIALGVGAAAAVLARWFVQLIGLITNISFFGRFSLTEASPADHHMGAWVILIPIAGAVIV